MGAFENALIEEGTREELIKYFLEARAQLADCRETNKRLVEIIEHLRLKIAGFEGSGEVE